MDRRRLLAALATTGIAGCLGDGGSDPTATPETTGTPETTAPPQTTGTPAASQTPTSTAGDTPSATATETDAPDTATPALGAVADHPAAANLRAQPRRGEFGGHVVLAFEDPSCVRCAAFHQRVVPEIRQNLVEPGKAAFVVRPYPVVYPWGDPASRALEATFARDEATFWGLLAYYYRNRDRFGMDNVLRLTESFLAGTGVDQNAVVADVESGAADEAVAANVAAAEAADLGRTTPVVLLFRDGQFVTSANGSVSYTLIANALGEA
ncbi:DsbA family protein [Halobaculum sp. MBLA0143]|uniref:DsbA family protein n=1 Tax=Halobaculum sp. MBLA0143 TaxID=3079933 RepID=UPI003526BB12